MFTQTIISCRKCGKRLEKGEKELAEKNGDGLCTECKYRIFTRTDTIKTYNEWLRKVRDNKNA